MNQYQRGTHSIWDWVSLQASPTSSTFLRFFPSGLRPSIRRTGPSRISAPRRVDQVRKRGELRCFLFVCLVAVIGPNAFWYQSEKLKSIPFSPLRGGFDPGLMHLGLSHVLELAPDPFVDIRARWVPIQVHQPLLRSIEMSHMEVPPEKGTRLHQGHLLPLAPFFGLAGA